METEIPLLRTVQRENLPVVQRSRDNRHAFQPDEKAAGLIAPAMQMGIVKNH